jgi:hypothetical protein
VWWFCRFVELTLRSPSLTAINLTACPALSRIDITSSSLEVLLNRFSRMHIPDMYWVQNTINSVSGAAMSVVRTGIQWQPNISMGLAVFHHNYSFGVWSGRSNNLNFVRDFVQCSCIVAGFVLREHRHSVMITENDTSIPGWCRNCNLGSNWGLPAWFCNVHGFVRLIWLSASC